MARSRPLCETSVSVDESKTTSAVEDVITGATPGQCPGRSWPLYKRLPLKTTSAVENVILGFTPKLPRFWTMKQMFCWWIGKTSHRSRATWFTDFYVYSTYSVLVDYTHLSTWCWSCCYSKIYIAVLNRKMSLGLMLKHAHFQDWFNPGRNNFIKNTARNCPGVVTPLPGRWEMKLGETIQTPWSTFISKTSRHREADRRSS